MKFTLKIGLLCVLAAGIAGQGVRAETYRITFATGHPPHLAWVKLVKEQFIPGVNKGLAGSGHEVVWTEAWSGTVAKVGGVLEAVQEGIAEAGIVYSLFEPAKLPLQNITLVVPFGSDNVPLVNRIIRELHEEVPGMAAAWESHGQVFLGGITLDTVHLFTKSPVSSIDELKGRKLGAAGTLSLWLESIGVVAVQGNFATHFNNLKTGVYDGLMSSVTGAYPIKVHTITNHITRVNTGAVFVGGITINKGLWDAMPAEVQNVFRAAAREYSETASQTIANLTETFEKKMTEEGVKWGALPESERKRWAMKMPNYAKKWVEDNEKRGLAAGAVLTAFMDKLRANNVALVREWDKE